MPLYEYECDACGERFETLVSASSRDETKQCPACGSDETERVPSTFAVGTSSTGGASCPTCPTGTCNL